MLQERLSGRTVSLAPFDFGMRTAGRTQPADILAFAILTRIGSSQLLSCSLRSRSRVTAPEGERRAALSAHQ